MTKIIGKVLFYNILLITAANNKFIDPIMTVGFHDMPQDGLTPISTIGLGIRLVASLRRVPQPPAKITAFISYTL